MRRNFSTIFALVVCGGTLLCDSTAAKTLSAKPLSPALERMIADRNFDIKNNPLDPSAYDRRANTLMDAGRYVEALRDSEKAVLLNPFFQEYYVTRGFARWFSKDFEGGKNDFLYAATMVQIEGNNGLVRRAMLKAMGDDYDGAEADLDAALKFGDDIRIHDVRAHIRDRHGDHIGRISDDMLKGFKETFPSAIPLIRSFTIKQTPEQN